MNGRRNFRRSRAALVLAASLMLCSGLSVHAQNSSAEVTTITITRARRTDYRKDSTTGNDTVVLDGDVEISVSKGDSSSVISADSVTYDRKTEMLHARGNVSIETSGGGDGTDRTYADSLLMNTSTMEGIFDDGRVVQTQTDALSLPSGSTLIVFSDIFGKSESNTIAFRNSSLTFCDDEDPHWRIDASRTWLLPGGEFAFLNALLYVGSVPVLYFPAFYYPKDELVFNPVFGYKSRRGYFVQTTTYLYGRKPLDTSSAASSSSSSETSSSASDSLKSLYNFMRPTVLKEQELQGLVLHNLDADYQGNTTDYIKVMADWYSNLGAMAGISANFQPQSSPVTSLRLDLQLGFSTTVFSSSGKYSPVSPSGKIYWDRSDFLGLELPFRYALDAGFTMTKPFRLSLSLPLYSDPYYSYDFRDRSEYMDWISFLMDGTRDDSETETVSEISSFIWQLTTSYSAVLPAFIKPYVSSLSLNQKSSVNISSVQTGSAELRAMDEASGGDGWTSYTPLRKFYYPSQVTPLNLSMSVSGTVFQWPPASSSAGKKNAAASASASALNRPDVLKPESQLEKERAEAEKKDAEETEETSAAGQPGTESLDDAAAPVMPVLPELAFTPSSSSVPEGLTYRLGYSLAPNFTSQLAYSSSKLREPSDFRWENARSFMYTLKIPASVTSALNYGGEFFSMSNKIAWDPVFQRHPFISTDESTGGYSESARKSLIRTDYSAESRNLTNTNSVGIRPFFYVGPFRDTRVVWNSTLKLFRRKFIGDADNPEWENLPLDWDDSDSVTVNSVDVVLAASQRGGKFSQSLTFSTYLPPQLRTYSAALNLVFPYATFAVSAGLEQKSKTDVTMKKKPLQQSLTVSLFGSSLKFTESYNYNLEDGYHDSLKLALSWKSLQLAYTMSYTYGYDFDTLSGWNIRSGMEFLPHSLSFSFAPSVKTYHAWFNRLSVAPGLNTGIVADLIRPTNSYFIFSPSLSFRLNEFLTLTFSSTSRNSVVYRYFGREIDIPGEKNLLTDLLNSFRFDDENLRKASGFKLKSLKFEMTHELHDWKFNMSLKIEPRLLTEGGVKRYDFNPYMTVGIVWNPMESMKTQIVDDYGTWKLNP